MDERLYRFRPDQAVFETGTAQGKQLLLANNVQDVLLHWFAPDGEFLAMERIPINPATLPPGHRQWLAGKVIAEGFSWSERVKRQLDALKEQLGFVPCEIAIHKFESEEASIYDLPGEYVQFLENPEAYSKEDRQAFEGYIERWRQAKDFVLEFCNEYWMNASGEVTSS